MSESLKNEQTVRDYLLGRISEDSRLEEIEELMFSDEDYCSQLELAEDGLINDYVRGHLDESDAESFRQTIASNPERRLKLELTHELRARALARSARVADDKKSFFTSLKLFFSQPAYAGAFAALLIAVAVLAVYWTRNRSQDELAELRSIYQTSRPTETRITEFGYAPLSQLRGAPEAADQKRLRQIENSLIDATLKTPNEQSHYRLGVFYVTQQKYPEAIREFNAALKFATGNAKIHNDLGVAHFEQSKIVRKEEKLKDLAQALEEFTKATELDGNLLEALFNKSLALQELGLTRQARESWNLYLQKDPSSPWAEEARKNLARLGNDQSQFPSDEKVLSDFLAAYRERDEGRAQRIHNETKGLLKDPAVPLQLSRRYLLAKQIGNASDTKESVAALKFIGDYEQSQNDDLFFKELADFYANAGTEKTDHLLQAKEMFASAQQMVLSDYAQAISQFEKSRDLFKQLGNTCEADIADIWAAQLLPDVGKIAEGRERLAAIIANAENRKFVVLLPPAYYSLGIGDYRQNQLSESARNLKSALRLAEAGKNTFEIQHTEDALTFNYSKIYELEPALSYASRLLSDQALHYQSPTQWWRSRGTVAELLLKLKLFSTALSFSREALSMSQKHFPGDVRLNNSLRHAANAALAKGDFTSSLKYANESMQIALKRADSAENARTKAEGYRLLAEIKRRSEDCGEALAEYDRALDQYARLPELTVNSYEIHKGKLLCFHQRGEAENFAVELRAVLDLSETFRRTLREDNSRRAFFADEQVVFDAAVDNAIGQRDSPSAFSYVESSKARSLLEFVSSPKSIAEVENDFASVAKPLSLKEIQTLLPEQLEVVQYAVLPDKLVIWIVSKTRFELIEKPIPAAELENRIDAYQASIRGKTPAANLKQTAQELFDLLIPPGLTAGKQLCLVPDKCLHQLAFATLVSPGGRYLLEDYSLFYAPSVSVLLAATNNAQRKNRVKSESLLSIGNPDFDREENATLPDLRSAEEEATTIAKDYRHSPAMLGGEATKEKFLQNFVNADVIHFAGHFVTNRQSPGNSKLLFAGGELRSSQLSSYKLPKAKLVVLSACETGFEQFDKSEGAIGIARTFLALGAPLVLATNWRVDSDATKDLMIAFHKNRKAKEMTSTESLRQAQLEMLSSEKTSAPFYWAAFSLYGGAADY